MGKYHLFGYYNRKPAYQHESGLDYLFYAEGEAWVIGAMFGGARVGIVNFDKHPCPYELKSLWRHSGKNWTYLFAALLLYSDYCELTRFIMCMKLYFYSWWEARKRSWNHYGLSR